MKELGRPFKSSSSVAVADGSTNASHYLCIYDIVRMYIVVVVVVVTEMALDHCSRSHSIFFPFVLGSSCGHCDSAARFFRRGEENKNHQKNKED